MKRVSESLLYISLLTFISFVIYILFINKEVLFTAQDRSEFLPGMSFFSTLLSQPFGLIQYAGAWLTQLLYHPASGACVLGCFWLLIYFVGKKAFRLKGTATAVMLLPVAFLLTSIVDLGYWIYIFSIKGYWFSQTIGYLIMLLLLWASHQSPRKWHLFWYILGFFLYPVLGWFALLFVLCLAISDKPSLREIIAVLVILLAAYVWRTILYSNMRIDDVLLAGLPNFVTPVENSFRLSIPFYVLGGVSVLISLIGPYLKRCIVPVLSLVIGIVFTMSFMYRDKNYIDEMRMVRHASNDNWIEVIDVAASNTTPTATMILLKNIALMNEGGLLNQSFKLGNNGAVANNPDSLHVSLLNIASPLVCYNYGMMNEAIRLCYENAVATGFSPFYIKMIARCASVTGEEQLVKRCTRLLRNNIHEANWQPALATEKIKTLHKSMLDEVYGVENNCERYIVDNLSLLTDTVSKVIAEQALFYSMMRCDSHRFWTSLRQYVKTHMEESFPIHAMEAYIMYMDKAPEKKRIMLPVEQSVYERYNLFWETLEDYINGGVATKDIPEKMRGSFGDTYWYYNVFSTNIH